MAEQILPLPVHNNVYILSRNTGTALVVTIKFKVKETQIHKNV
jgi:hypothetical protein